MTTQDIAGQTRRLFSSTTKLLGLDEAKLSVAEKIRVDRASTLRLLLDDMQSAQLNGGAIDVGAFIKASEELERLAGGNPEATTTHDFAGAKEELSQLLARRADGIERGLARDPAKARAALEARIADASAKYGSPLVATAPVEAAVTQAPPPVEPVPSPPPRRPGNVVPLDANTRRPPPQYLADYQHQNEPWRGSGGGVLAGAAWPPPPDDRRK